MVAGNLFDVRTKSKEPAAFMCTAARPILSDVYRVGTTPVR